MHDYSWWFRERSLSVKDDWVHESQLCELVPNEGKLVEERANS